MRRLLHPLFLVIIGFGLIAAYLIFRPGPAEPQLPPGATAPSTPPSLARQLTSAPPSTVEPVGSPTQTAQPIIPTRTVHPFQPEATETVAVTLAGSVSPGADLPEPDPCPLPDCRNRVGVSGRKEMVSAAYEAGLPFAHYLNWWVERNPPGPDDVTFWQLVPITAAGPSISWENLGQIVDARPGSIWIVGNEPDILWQDNIPAGRYAQIYHEIYTFIKERDPTARLAIAGVGQPSLLRMAYLDTVLDSYRESFGERLPIDIWTIHAFLLREQEDSWGVGIPTGMTEKEGELYEVVDHNNLAYFEQNIINFRAWMAERGYNELPLAVTEYGILHPADYGFPPEIVAEFMIGAFNFFATAANETGYPADENRLVQWWFWYSVYDDGDYPTGNLFDPETGQLTLVGELFTALVSGE